MNTYHPKSWSQQARELCDNQVEQIKAGWTTIEWAEHFFSTSYRHSLIRNRAAKRFGRLVRAGKVKNNYELFKTHWSDEEIVQQWVYNKKPLPYWLKDKVAEITLIE
mgnify:CR=1 FL=1